MYIHISCIIRQCICKYFWLHTTQRAGGEIAGEILAEETRDLYRGAGEAPRCDLVNLGSATMAAVWYFGQVVLKESQLQTHFSNSGFTNVQSQPWDVLVLPGLELGCGCHTHPAMGWCTDLLPKSRMITKTFWCDWHFLITWIDEIGEFQWPDFTCVFSICKSIRVWLQDEYDRAYPSSRNKPKIFDMSIQI